MYPYETLNNEVKRYCKAFVNKGRALGELGHPEGPTVNLDVYKITSLKAEGNNFMGSLNPRTPMGKIASSSSMRVYVWLLRGVGSLKTTSEGCKIVGEDFQLATAADIVADPSAPDALLMELWKEESGFGKEESFANNSLKQPRRESLLLIKTT